MLNRTEQLKKLEDKGENSVTLVEIMLFPALQTSFLNFTIKFKQNIKPPTDERINSILFYSVVFIKNYSENLQTFAIEFSPEKFKKLLGTH